MVVLPTNFALTLLTLVGLVDEGLALTVIEEKTNKTNKTQANVHIITF